MTNEEIKKAFNKFKKEAEKELSFSLSGRCYMNKKQIENRTGTIALNCNISYEEEIRGLQEAIDAVRGYENWTAAEKEQSISRNRREIDYYEALREQYGDRVTEASEKMMAVVSSASFDRFCKALDYTVRYRLEKIAVNSHFDRFQIRISY